MPSPVIDAIVSKALDGLYLRQLTTAHNLANANSPGFVPLQTNFEGELRHLLELARGADAVVATQALSTWTPTVVAAPMAATDGVKIDQEVATASETSARYALLIGMLNRNLQMQQLAVRGS